MDDGRDNLVERLVGVLREQLEVCERLAALLQAKRAALRAARYPRLTELCELENQAVQRIGELEKQRLTLVAELTLAVEPNAPEPMRLAVLAERLAEPQRGRLLVLRQQLVERMAWIKQETGIVRRATESLVTHMRGLVQTVGALCAGAPVYDQRGAAPVRTLTISTFNAVA